MTRQFVEYSEETTGIKVALTILSESSWGVLRLS